MPLHYSKYINLGNVFYDIILKTEMANWSNAEKSKEINHQWNSRSNEEKEV